MNRFYTLDFAAPHFKLTPEHLLDLLNSIKEYPARMIKTDTKPILLYTRDSLQKAWNNRGSDHV